MVDAYEKGKRRPKFEWAFRVAGYGEGTYDLRHITRRKAFFDSFAQGGASAGASLPLLSNQRRPAKCERGSSQRPG